MRIQNCRAIKFTSLFSTISAIIFAAMLSLTSMIAWSVVDIHEFSDPNMESDYRGLIAELRCPKCQNQNLADSDAPLAKDLRQKVYDQLNQGKSSSEIKQYMIDRYGDFITYRPPLTTKTIVLWGLPWLLVVLALVAIWRRSRNTEMKTTLDPKEQAALAAALAQSNAASDIDVQKSENKDAQ